MIIIIIGHRNVFSCFLKWPWLWKLLQWVYHFVCNYKWSCWLTRSREERLGRARSPAGGQISSKAREAQAASGSSGTGADGRMKGSDGCRRRVRWKEGELEDECKVWKNQGGTGCGGVKCGNVQRHVFRLYLHLERQMARRSEQIVGNPLRNLWVINYGSHSFLPKGLYDVTPTLIHHETSLFHLRRGYDRGHSAALSVWRLLYAYFLCLKPNPCSTAAQRSGLAPRGQKVGACTFSPFSEHSHSWTITGQLAAPNWPYVFVCVC